MADKTKILWIGDGGAATGFARVNHSIIENLSPTKYEIHHLAVNYMGDPYKTKKHHKLYPAMQAKNYGDFMGVNRVLELINEVNPDLVFILNDPWAVPQYLTRIPASIKIVVYTPVDAKPVLRSWAEVLNRVNRLVTYTEFGKEAYLEAFPEMDNLAVIPHGVDTDTFYDISRSEARKAVGLPEDLFVVFNGNRNQPRKRIDLTLRAFAKFAEGKDDVRLLLNMGEVDAGWNLKVLADRLGILPKVILTKKDFTPQNYLSDETLNLVYNAADVGINTSLGEGWGLINVEQACCRVAQIVPNSSACAEIFPDDSCLKIDVVDYMYHPDIMTEGQIISVDNLVEHLNTYYYDRNLLEKHSNAVYEHFTSPELQWKTIAKQWDKLFKKVLKEDPKALLLLEQEGKIEIERKKEE